MLISDRTPKSAKVDAGLDREAGAGEQPAIVVRFVVVHVHAVAVHRLAEAVACAVQDVVAVAGVLQHRGRGTVDFPAAHLPSGAARVLHEAPRRRRARSRTACERLGESLRRRSGR